MKKTLTAALIVSVLLCVAAPLCAQGPFADVPTDHWAYEAVNQLQQDGILIGYPDGTFGGKRAMTRYEFAVAVARMIPIIVAEAREDQPPPVTPPVTPPTGDFVTKDQLNQALAGKADKADVDALRRLVDEFRDELAALGVDVDCLKRDVAALNDRVTAIEKELARFKWNGVLDVSGTAADTDTGAPFDRDDRAFQAPGPAAGSFINNISVLENLALDLRAGLTPSVTANAKGIFGNYLSWIGTVDDYSVFTRPDSNATGLTTEAALYYANIDWGFGSGKITTGRQPIQWSPYTLKMIDVDSYNTIAYTDSGDYPIDGIRLNWRAGGSFVLDAFAAKNNEHELLANGLTSQPTSGLYNDVLGFGTPFHAVGGHAAGGLTSIDQSAGARIQFGGPFKGNIGASYMNAAGPFTVSPVTGGTYDNVDVFGADATFNFGSINLLANWAVTDTNAEIGADIDSDNTAIDGRLGWASGKFGIAAGWKRVEPNFGAPGFWDKLGRWTNPVNIEGWYGELNYCLTNSLNLFAEAAFYEGETALPVGVGNVFMNDAGDEIDYYQAGIKWGLSGANSILLGAEWVKWQPTAGIGIGDTDEVYYNIGWGYQLNPSASFKLLYQIVDYDSDAAVGPYGADYEGDLAVAQFGVKF